MVEFPPLPPLGVRCVFSNSFNQCLRCRIRKRHNFFQRLFADLKSIRPFGQFDRILAESSEEWSCNPPSECLPLVGGQGVAATKKTFNNLKLACIDARVADHHSLTRSSFLYFHDPCCAPTRSALGGFELRIVRDHDCSRQQIAEPLSILRKYDCQSSDNA